MNVLQVVIRPTPGQEASLPPAERTAHQKASAQAALHAAANLQGLHFDQLPRDEHGSPLAVDGQHWSVTHTRDYVAGAAALWPVGVDIERVRRLSDDVEQEAASGAELAMVATRFDETKEEAFARVWSAKEALLKLTGEGLAGLSHCLVAPSTSLEQRPGIWIRRGDRELFVHQERNGAHFVSLACEPINRVNWNWQMDAAQQTSPQTESQ